MIAQARENGDFLGELLQHYRSFLLLVAQRSLHPKAAVRYDPSDVVQQTFEEASKGFASFGGSTEEEFSAWIQRIHAHNLCDAARMHLDSEKRSVKRERQLYASDRSPVILWREPAGEQSTPSRRAIRGEQALRLARILQSLPEAQRDAVRLRHLEGLSIGQGIPG